MKRRFVPVCCLFTVTFALAAEDHAVKLPFRASLHADCSLGRDPDRFWVTVDRASAAHTRITFNPERPSKTTPSFVFVVPGVLAGFGTLGTDLELSFDNPGPITRVYSEVDGKVQQIFECTSRFGAEDVPIGTVYGGALVCPQGEEMVGRLWLPTIAKIYLRGEKGFELAAEVPYNQLFQTLSEINIRETQKLSAR